MSPNAGGPLRSASSPTSESFTDRQAGSGTPAEQVANFASLHGGVITLTAARNAGLSQAQCARRVKAGIWIRLHPGVFVVNGVPDALVAKRFGAVLGTTCASVCSHDTAALIHGLTKAVDKAKVHVLQERTSSHTKLKGVIRHKSKFFLLDDFTLIGKLPVTNASRTICDIAERFDQRTLGKMVDHAERTKLLTIEQLQRTSTRLQEAPGRGVDVLRAVLADRGADWDPGASSLEAEVISMLSKSGLPMPRIGFAITLGGIRFHLDLAWPEHRVCVELDSWRYHQNRTAFDDDRKRTNLLVVNGWTALRFTDKTTGAEMLDMLRPLLLR
jgi:Transcriptional regulator, AbiEi antitoxin/Protein of unknown function (DUF559)